MRSSLAGSLWALVLGGVGLGVASQVSNPPSGSAQIETPQLPIPEETPEPVAMAEVEPDETDAMPEALPIAEPDNDTVPVAEATPDPAPEAATVDTVLTDVEPVPDLPETPEDEEPVALEALEPAPIAPLADDQAVIVTDVMEPAEALPEVDAAETAPVTGDDEGTDVAVTTPDTTDDETDLTEDTEVTSPDMAIVVPANEEETDTPPSDVATAVESNAASDVPVAAAVDDVPQEPATEEDTTAPAEADEEQQAETQDVDVPTPQVPEAEAPNIDEPETDVAVSEPEEEAPAAASSGVRINRPGATPSEAAGQEAEVVTEDVVDQDGPALERFAADFENPENLPLMVVILIDQDALPDAVDQIAGLPVPVTVILDPLTPGATAQMQRYRAAGVEVGMQISLPLGATPTDVEVAFEAAFGTLPEAVALFSDGTGVLQNNRAVTEQVIEVLAADGRGLVAVQRGLGNAVRTAQQAEVPAATVLRDIDGDGQTAGAIGRALDQAAFRIRQTGSGVLLGRVQAETLNALSIWGADTDAAQLAVAPLTGLLLSTGE